MRTDWSRSPSGGEDALGPAGSRRPSAQSKRRLGPLVIAASVAIGALSLAACGGGGSPSSNAVAHVGTSTGAKNTGSDRPSNGGGGTSSATASATAIKFAGCVRAHGVPNFPDSAVTMSPGGDVEFRLSKGAVNPNSAQFKSAMQACQSLIPHAGNGRGPSTGQMDKLIKYSNCMRSHGVPNFPEPSSNGEISVQVTGGAANNPMNPNSPQFQAASKACRSLQPPGLTGL